MGLEIELEKQIPSEAGLGGGSSDAAATLWAANRLWGISWSNQRLAELSAELGSDIPWFFLMARGLCAVAANSLKRSMAFLHSLW